MVSADRIAHPACFEHHRLAQPVAISLVSAKGSTAVVCIRNEFDFLTLGDAGIRGRWTLRADGLALRRGPLTSLKNLAPSDAGNVPIPLGELPSEAREFHLDVEFFLHAETPWAPAGHIVASGQLSFPKQKRAKIGAKKNPTTAAISQTSDRITATAGDIEVGFDKITGELDSLRCSGREFLFRGPQLQLWRGAVDNDGIRLKETPGNNALARWMAIGLEKGLIRKLGGIRIHKSPQTRDISVTIIHQATTAKRKNWRDLRHTHSYTLRSDGSLLVTNEFVVAASLNDLPRIGVSLALIPGFEQLRYFGRGPFENYSDRKASADLRVWESTVMGEYVDYVMPQEHGHHTDTRWLELTMSGGNTLRVEGSPTFEFNATHFTAEDLFACRHTTDLVPRPETVLYLDAAHRGVGTASCGPDTLEEYRLSFGTYHLSFLLSAR
jgi:beta-galactosidase